MAFEASNTKAFVFEASVGRFLVPTLQPRQKIVVMDNLSAHKTFHREEGRFCQANVVDSHRPRKPSTIGALPLRFYSAVDTL
jgi:hypothetical protein